MLTMFFFYVFIVEKTVEEESREMFHLEHKKSTPVLQYNIKRKLI